MNPSDFKAKLKSIFVDEANEHIQSLDSNFVLLETQFKESKKFGNTLNEIFRSFHTLKASVASMSFLKTGKELHDLESVLAQIRQDESLVNLEIIQDLFTAFDLIKGDIAQLIETDQDSECLEAREMIAKIIKRIKAKSDGKFANPDSPVVFKSKGIKSEEPAKNKDEVHVEPRHYQIVFRPFPGLLRNGFDPLILFYDLRELGEFVSVNLSYGTVPTLKELSLDELYLTWEILVSSKKSIQKIQEVFLFVSHSSDLQIEDVSSRFSPEGLQKTLANKKIGEILLERSLVTEESVKETLSKQKKIGEMLVESNKVAPKDLEKAVQDQETARKSASSSIRVDISKLDSLLDLVGELVIAESRLKNSSNDIENKDVRRGVVRRCDEIRRLIADLQERVMNVRMVPMDSLFSQFHRVIRDLSQSQQKIVRLVLVGQETEIDKNIIEKINSPLKHLVRNAVDHGLERPDDREKIGKNKEALVTLKSYQKEGSVFIEVCDDGRGLNVDSIREKGLEKGLITKEEVLTEEQLFNLIFLPGFSTAKEITDVSGRGVGMDVVKKSVEELNGTIQIFSEKGKGTRMVIKLPLTMAIIEGLLFRVADRKFAIPLLAVDSTIRPRKGDVRTIEGRGEFVELRGQPVSLVRLNRLFKIQNSEQDPSNALLLNVKVHGKQYAFMVDDVLGQQQVVLKSLEKNFEKVEGFSGATILGDGSVASIIDPEDLVGVFKSK